MSDIQKFIPATLPVFPMPVEKIAEEGNKPRLYSRNHFTAMDSPVVAGDPPATSRFVHGL